MTTITRAMEAARAHGILISILITWDGKLAIQGRRQPRRSPDGVLFNRVRLVESEDPAEIARTIIEIVSEDA